MMLTLPLAAESLPVTLQIEAGGGSEVYYYTSGGQAYTNSSVGGLIEVELGLDVLDAKPETFEFVGGSVSYSDSETVYSPNQLPKVEELRFTTANLEGPLGTLTSEAQVAEDGLFSNADHTQSFTFGTLRTEYRVLLIGTWVTLFDVTRDYGLEPEVRPAEGLNWITTEAVEGAGTVLTETLEVRYENVANAEPVVVPLGATSLTVVTAGGFVASSQVEVPSAALRQWRVAGGHLPGWQEPGGSSAVIFALGCDPGTVAVPLHVDPAGSRARLTLPPAGTRLPIHLETSVNLNGWTPAPLTGGGFVIPAGSTGEVEVDLPSEGRGFVRVVAIDG